MTASKAAAGKKKEKRKVVTFRIDDVEHQRLVDYAISLSAIKHTRVSNNDAMRHMLRNSRPPTTRTRKKPDGAAVADA